MKYTSLILSAFLFSISIAHAEIYVCKKANGTTEYTAEKKANCSVIADAQVGGYSSVSTATNYYSDSNASSSFESESTTNHDEARSAAEQRLRDAERALEEGRNTRLGNERNYAKYEERIQGLEEEVRRAREALRR